MPQKTHPSIAASTHRFCGTPYLSRFPVLVHQKWLTGLPDDAGISEGDLRDVVVSASAELELLFPDAWETVSIGGPADSDSIYQQVATGTDLAKHYPLGSVPMREFLVPRYELVSGILARFTSEALTSNIETLMAAVLEQRVETWWADFEASYRDTFQQWCFAGAFVGGSRQPEAFLLWPSLEQRLQRREWLIRLGAGW